MTEHQRRAAEQLLEEVRTTLGVLSVVHTWVGVALLIVAFVLAMYLGAGLLGEWAVRATYP